MSDIQAKAFPPAPATIVSVEDRKAAVDVLLAIARGDRYNAYLPNTDDRIRAAQIILQTFPY